MHITLKTVFPPADGFQNDPDSETFISKKVTVTAHALLSFIILGMVLIDCGSCRANEWIDYQGVTGFYGRSNWTNIGPDPVDEYEWYNISYFLGKDLKPWLSLETLLGPGYIKIDNFNETGTLEWRLRLDIHDKYFYFKLGTGVAYLFESGNMPDLSGADFYSIVTCSLGFHYSFLENGKNGPDIKLGYSVEHLSDPFKRGVDGDTGLNVGAINLLFSWYF